MASGRAWSSAELQQELPIIQLKKVSWLQLHQDILNLLGHKRITSRNLFYIPSVQDFFLWLMENSACVTISPAPSYAMNRPHWNALSWWNVFMFQHAYDKERWSYVSHLTSCCMYGFSPGSRRASYLKEALSTALQCFTTFYFWLPRSASLSEKNSQCRPPSQWKTISYQPTPSHGLFTAACTQRNMTKRKINLFLPGKSDVLRHCQWQTLHQPPLKAAEGKEPWSIPMWSLASVFSGDMRRKRTTSEDLTSPFHCSQE